MSEGVNPAVDNYQNAIAEATRQRKARAKVKAELEAAQAQLAALSTELEQLKAAPDENAKEVERLKAEIRLRDHRSAWDKAAAGKVRPDALDAAWRLSQWVADTDEIDSEKLNQNIESLLASNEFLAAPESAESDSPGTSGLSKSPGPPTPLAGFGRGPAPKSTETNTPRVFRL